MENHLMENKLIVELSKPIDCNLNYIISAFEQKPDYAYVLGQLLFNRTGGIAYQNLKKCNTLSNINREFRNPLYMIYQNGCKRNDSYLEAESELSKIFSKADFRYSFLKGALLCTLYEAGTRTSNDFDVLISKRDIGKITKLLLSEGFEQGYLKNDVFSKATRQDIIYAQMNKGETVPFVKRISLPNMEWLEIDVNFSLDFNPIDDTGVVDDFLLKSEPLIKTANGNLSTLCLSDFIIHLCSHLYKEATTMFWIDNVRDLSIYKFSDIYLLWKKYASLPLSEELIKTIKKYHLENECAYSFYYMSKLFNVNDDILNTLIKKIFDRNEENLKIVFDPATKKEYYFDTSFVDYLFCMDRKKHLIEI